uniref:HDC07260 n=1 Tax=Drosophila melanogaster TaxID=7227 RepID=Q6IG42_DROME|nr:TPA_inf: HDC07260 [Drosophila melanogaster]
MRGTCWNCYISQGLTWFPTRASSQSLVIVALVALPLQLSYDAPLRINGAQLQQSDVLLRTLLPPIYHNGRSCGGVTSFPSHHILFSPCGWILVLTPWFNQLAIFCALLLLLMLLLVLKGLSGEMKMPRIYPLVKYYTSTAEAVSASASVSCYCYCYCSSFYSNENNANRFY